MRYFKVKVQKMTNTLIKETVNIHAYPKTTPVVEGSQITIGDLHGNALKFLFFLIKHEIVSCDEKQYTSFKEIYQKDTNDLTPEELSSMKTICEQLIVKNKHKICLLGDELADRGQNDYFMLLLFAKLHKESVPMDILLSNHGYTFIESLEKDQGFYSGNPWGDRVYGRSIHQMQDLINAGMLDKEEIKEIAKTAYLPHLKLLSYTIDSINEITLYHHACIDEEVIAKITDTMVVDFNANTVKELSGTIDAINFSFQKKWVETHLVHKLPKNLSGDTIPKSDPIAFLIFNRDYSILNYTQRPYTVNRVHGHDSSGLFVSGIYCLNNSLGIHHIFFNEGEYSVLLSIADGLLNEKVLLEQKKESIYVNTFFADLTNKPPTSNKSFNLHVLAFEEENKENSWMCALY
jgi:hypothetical protein